MGVTSVKDKLKILIQLQACDTRISEIINQKNKAPLEIQKLQQDLQSAKEILEEDANRLEALKKDRQRIEQEIHELENKIEKSNSKLLNIKSNKEYAAALKEIEDLKTAKFQTEEKTIQMMEEIEALETKTASNKEKQNLLTKKFEDDKRELDKQLGSLDQELKVLQKKSEELRQASDKTLLKKYQFLRERKGGLALSAVIAGVCQTCHMGIPPQKFNELLRGNVLMTCPFCNRMIYWGDDEHFQTAQNSV